MTLSQLSTKPVHRSLTIQALFVSLLAFALQHFGILVEPESISQLVAEAVQFFSLIIAFWGRIRAKERVSL